MSSLNSLTVAVDVASRKRDAARKMLQDALAEYTPDVDLESELPAVGANFAEEVRRELLDRYPLFGPPALLFFAANGGEITADRVIGEINAGEFAQILTRVRGKVGL